MSMTPYEIRLELLKMAQNLVSDEYSYNRSAKLEQWHTQVEAAKIAGRESPDIPELPAFPTESDIVKKAESLNLFVSQTPPQPEVKIKSKANS
jgi:hypothetical protein